MKVLDYLKLRQLMHHIEKQKLRLYEGKRWAKAFLYFLRHVTKTGNDYTNRWNIIKGFTGSDIKIVKRTAGTADLIVICVVRNEIERMEVFLNHYRKIGIEKFVIIDNNSTDGTIQFLRRQKDVDLYQTKDQFQSYVKIGWINRMISSYGTSHWYLVVDADELLVWQGMEEDGIKNVIKYLNRKRITRARALMVDMYPKEVKWNSSESFKEIFPKCNYFDGDSYYHEEAEELYLICGGPRNRMLGMEPWLTKYPLFRLREREILSSAHTVFPYENRKVPCFFALLHYKFLTRSDLVKVKKYAREGNYIGGSAEYKIYEKKHKENADNFNFYYENSLTYQSSQSLAGIQEISKM